ncbi:hypothetical protein COLO4_25449 [Corchorus olitorius]|uniref:Uncharacterized protein n=1 Tax=Corchorus olitorius TaxID=93759 RepID=A0A1R3I2L1_9ROSI|nr:hypothetical protein COLO4_25449 [Corchorus olitorius]
MPPPLLVASELRATANEAQKTLDHGRILESLNVFCGEEVAKGGKVEVKDGDLCIRVAPRRWELRLLLTEQVKYFAFYLLSMPV